MLSAEANSGFVVLPSAREQFSAVGKPPQFAQQIASDSGAPAVWCYHHDDKQTTRVTSTAEDRPGSNHRRCLLVDKRAAPTVVGAEIQTVNR